MRLAPLLSAAFFASSLFCTVQGQTGLAQNSQNSQTPERTVATYTPTYTSTPTYTYTSTPMSTFKSTSESASSEAVSSKTKPSESELTKSTSETTAQGVHTESGSPKSSTSKGPIIGGVVGGIVILLSIGLGVFLLRRNKKRRQDSLGVLEKSLDSSSPSQSGERTLNYPTTSSPIDTGPSTAGGVYDRSPHQNNQEYQRYSSGHQIPQFPAQAVGYSERSRDLDDDGVSIRSPSPVLTPAPESHQKSVPRLPIYQRGVGDGRSSPAL